MSKLYIMIWCFYHKSSVSGEIKVVKHISTGWEHWHLLHHDVSQNTLVKVTSRGPEIDKGIEDINYEESCLTKIVRIFVKWRACRHMYIVIWLQTHFHKHDNSPLTDRQEHLAWTSQCRYTRTLRQSYDTMMYDSSAADYMTAVFLAMDAMAVGSWSFIAKNNFKNTRGSRLPIKTHIATEFMKV